LNWGSVGDQMGKGERLTSALGVTQGKWGRAGEPQRRKIHVNKKKTSNAACKYRYLKKVPSFLYCEKRRDISITLR